MSYSRKYLRTLNSSASKEEVQKVTTELLQKLHDGEPLTIAERYWICPFMQIIYNSEDGKALDPFDFPGCKEAVFRDRYLLYFNNIEGWRPAKDFYGEIPHHIKQRDLDLLDREATNWATIIEVTNHSDQILQFTAKEVRDQLKEITKYCAGQFGYNREKHLQKQFLLHSKYMYHLVCEYYEENNSEIVIQVCGQDVYINAYVYIHVLSRHFAQLVKEHMLDKSYHDERVDHLNLPDQLADILKCYDAISPKSFDGKKIYFKIKGDVFVIWIKVDKGTRPHRLRINSFYPVTDPVELKGLENYNDLVQSGDYEFYD